MASGQNLRARRPPLPLRLLAIASALILVQESVAARADEKGSSPNRKMDESSPAAAQLRAELAVHAERARRERVVINVNTLAAGAALVPTGLVLSTRDDRLPKTLGFGMILGGSIPLLFVFATILPSPMERLYDALEAQRASGIVDWRRPF